MTEQTALAANETTPAGGIRRGLVASGLLVAALLVLLPVKYVVNDDPGFVMMLSGSDGFPATSDVPFISRILCETLHGLYRLAPAVPWYGIALYLSAWLGLALFLSVPLADRLPRSRAIILLVGWLPYLAFGLYNISMTNITLLLQLGAILHLLFWLRSGRSFRLPTGWIVAGLAVGYLWRWELFLPFSCFKRFIGRRRRVGNGCEC